MEMLRVLLVDDQKLFIENLKTVLDLTAEDIEVVGMAYDGREALAKIEELKPEVVLMDVRMPVMDGVEATKIIRDNNWNVKILMLTTFDDDDYIHDALKAGADGYILKNIPSHDLFESIRSMRSGGMLISPEVAHKVVEWEERAKGRGTAPSSGRMRIKQEFESLSARERELINLIAMAYTNREIAERMYISEQTVKNYISKIYAKIGVSRRSQLMKLYHDSQG